MEQGDSASVLTRAKVWKMREYWMYFPFFMLHDWGKRSAEARSSHCAVLPKYDCETESFLCIFQTSQPTYFNHPEGIP